MQPSVDERVRSAIAGTLGVQPAALSDATSFESDLQADSLDTIEITMALEEEFDVDISDRDAARLKTVRETIDYVQSRISAVPASSTG